MTDWQTIETAPTIRFTYEPCDGIFWDDQKVTFACGEKALSLNASDLLVKYWQPIETAPKDSVIMVYEPAPFGGIFLAEWSEGRGLFAVHIDGAPLHPSHWMPLPPAPTVLESE